MFSNNRLSNYITIVSGYYNIFKSDILELIEIYMPSIS